MLNWQVLCQIKATSDPRSNFFEERGRMTLVRKDILKKVLRNNFQAQILMDLFLAGGETSATTLAWSVVHMVRHPDIQVQDFLYIGQSKIS